MDTVVKWEDISFIISSSYREKVLSMLDKPKTPSKLSKELNINIAHISRALDELEKRKMVKCLTPQAMKGRLYVIGDYGKKILKQKQENIS